MYKWLTVLALGLLMGCSSGSGGAEIVDGGGEVGPTFKTFEVGNCGVDTGLLMDGGPPKDGIPAILEPIVQNLDEINPQFNVVADEDELVLIMDINGEQRAYPEMILWNHEIINDTLGDASIAVSYCPLTGSAVSFERGSEELWGVSGILYETNLVMYDWDTDSLWPQMNLRSECGDRRGESLALLPVKEMTMGFLKQFYPTISTVVDGTRTDLFYGAYPYGSYDVVGNDSLLFPVTDLDTTYPIKSLVLTVHVDNDLKGYPHVLFEGDGIINDVQGDTPYAVFHIDAGRYANAFSRQVGDAIVNLSLVADDSAPGGYWLSDANSGTIWSLIGEGVSGSLAETPLTQMLNFNVMWFSYKVSFPNAPTFAPSSKDGLELFE